MSDEREYLIRPAPARGQRSYTLTPQTLDCKGKNGWSLQLDKLQTANFVQHRIGDQVMWRLDLEDGGTSQSIATSFPYSTRTQSEDCASFIELCQILSGNISKSNPDFQIGYGEHGKARLVLFGIGVVSALFGIGLLLAALLSGVSGERLLGGGVAIGLLVIFGLVLARGYSPWRKPIPVDVARFPKVLRYLAGQRSSEPAAGQNT